MVTRILDWMFVAGCAACDAVVAADAPFCLPCEVSLYGLDSACPRCAEPIEGPSSLVCGRCLRKPLPIESIHAGYRFGGQLAVAMRRLKFGQHRHVARALALLLRETLEIAAGDCDLLVPVPLHRRRLAARGFNQSQLLLRYARRWTNLQIDASCLRRDRPTVPQSGLDAARRAANVRGAFSAPARAISRLAGRRVLLFDDVVTTGATMAAAAAALRHAGASSVVGLCLARAEAG